MPQMKCLAGSQRERSAQRSRVSARAGGRGQQKSIVSATEEENHQALADLDPTQLPLKRDKDAKVPEPLCNQVVNSTGGWMQEGGSSESQLSPSGPLLEHSPLKDTQRTAWRGHERLQCWAAGLGWVGGIGVELILKFLFFIFTDL